MISSFAKIALCFIIGVLASELPLFLAILTPIIVTVFVLFVEKSKKGLFYSLLILTLSFFSGIIYSQVYQEVNTYLVKDEIELQDKSFTIVNSKTTAFAKSLVCEFESENRSVQKCKISIYNDSREYFSGDQVKISKVRMKKIKLSGFGYQVDFNKFLLLKNIRYYGSIDSSSIIIERGKLKSNVWIYKLRNSIKSKLKRNLAENYDVVAAICLGDKNDLDLSSKNAFIKNGVAHIMAVSGLHIGIVYLLILQIFKLTRKDKTILAATISLSLVWSFILLTGAPVSAIRAGLMISIYTVFKLLNRKNEKIHILSFTAFVILLWDPNQLESIGFLLSFGALIGILFFSDKIKNCYQPKNIFLMYFWEIIVVTLAVQITTLPLIIYYFHAFPLHFIFTNLLAIPFAFIVLILFLLFLVFYFLPVIHELILSLLNYIISGFLNTLSWFDQFPSLYLENLYLFKSVLIVYYFSLLFISLIKINLLKKLGIVLSLSLITFSFSYKSESLKNEAYVFYNKGFGLLHKQGLNSVLMVENERCQTKYLHPIITNNLKRTHLSKAKIIEFDGHRILLNPELKDLVNKEYSLIYCDAIIACKRAMKYSKAYIYVPAKLKRRIKSERLIVLKDFVKL